MIVVLGDYNISIPEVYNNVPQEQVRQVKNVYFHPSFKYNTTSTFNDVLVDYSNTNAQEPFQGTPSANVFETYRSLNVFEWHLPLFNHVYICISLINYPHVYKLPPSHFCTTSLITMLVSTLKRRIHCDKKLSIVPCIEGL